MDAKTGDLLALAAAPHVRPGDLGKATPTSLVNQALAGVYEPGSTSKVMTASAALEEGVVTPTTPCTVPGTLKRSDRTFHDAESHATERLTFAGVLAKSSNIGTIEVGERMSPQTMWSYLTKFGVGQPTGLELPRRERGHPGQHQDWSGSQRYTVLFGQGLSVNAVQAAGSSRPSPTTGCGCPAAGRRLPSAAVRSTDTDRPGTGVRVISPAAAKQLRIMLEGVVSNDGTRRAADPGLPGGRQDRHRAAFDPTCGCYRGFTASFIGMAPADDPQLVVAVTLQRPVKGTTAARWPPRSSSRS